MEVTDRIQDHFSDFEALRLAINNETNLSIDALLKEGTIAAAIQLLYMMHAGQLDWCTDEWADKQKEIANSAGFDDGYREGVRETRNEMNQELEENIAVALNEAREQMEHDLRTEIGDSLELYYEERFAKAHDDYDAIVEMMQREEQDYKDILEACQRDCIRMRTRAEMAERKLHVLVGGKQPRKRIRRRLT